MLCISIDDLIVGHVCKVKGGEAAVVGGGGAAPLIIPILTASPLHR
jgi:hypothetical protein